VIAAVISFHSNQTRSAIRLGPRVYNRHARGVEVPTVEGHDRQIVHECGRSNEAVLDRHRAPLRTKRREQLSPSKPSRGIPGDTLQPLHALLEPALKPTPTATPCEQQNAETDLAQNDRIDGKLGLMEPKPLGHTPIRLWLGRLREDVRINQKARQWHQLQRVGRLRFDLHEPIVLRTRPQPFDQATVRRRREPGEPILVGANAVDLELLARLDAIGSTELGGEDDLTLRGDCGAHRM
jgi:hypothetical protein